MSFIFDNFCLYTNYPNPFNAETKVRFEILEKARVRLRIYDLLGRRIATLIDEERSPGLHEVSWYGTRDDGTACASGLYFYRLEVNDLAQTGKAILLK